MEKGFTTRCNDVASRGRQARERAAGRSRRRGAHLLAASGE